MGKGNIVDLIKIRYPEEYGTNYIVTHPVFNAELEDLMKNSGYVDEFKTKYHKSLRFLEKLKINCTAQQKLFELLKDSDGIYSMKLFGKKNIRILFDFQNIDNNKIVVLYHAFEERNTKDYTKSILIAQNRRQEIFGI